MYPKMHSDLKEALLKDRHGEEKLSWESRVRIALHTARALQYLHTGVKTERNIRFVFQNFFIIIHLPCWTIPHHLIQLKRACPLLGALIIQRMGGAYFVLQFSESI